MDKAAAKRRACAFAQALLFSFRDCDSVMLAEHDDGTPLSHADLERYWEALEELRAEMGRRSRERP